MIALSRPIGFLFLLLGIIAMTVQGRRSSSSPSSLSTSSTSNVMSTNTNTMESSKLSPLMRSILKLRSGEDIANEADVEEESDDESDDEEDDTPSSAIDYAVILQQVLERTKEVTKEVVDITKESIFPVVVKYSKQSAATAKKTSVSIYQAVRRAISAALEGEDAEESDDTDDEDSDDEGGEATVMDKVIVISKKSVAIVKRMIKAALTVPEDEGSAEEDDETDEDDEVTVESTEDETVIESQTTEVESTSTSSSAATDFGSYLAEAYGVDDMRNSGKTEGPIILGGSLEDALQTARQQARMLLVFIPSERPEGERGGLSSFFGGGKKSDAESDEMDRVAIESLLSKEVGKAANKKSKKNNDLGSFAIWGGKAGSSEAASAMKQLKVKETSAKGEKRPILCVVYPAVASVVSISSFSCLQFGRELSLSMSLKCIFSHLYLF
jgi:hypothetical protein